MSRFIYAECHGAVAAAAAVAAVVVVAAAAAVAAVVVVAAAVVSNFKDIWTNNFMVFTSWQKVY